MKAALLRQVGLHAGYIIPSQHWSTVERACEEEVSGKSALLVEVPVEMQQAFEATQSLGRSRLSTLRSAADLYFLVITLQIGDCQTRIVLHLAELHVRQYLTEAIVSGELLLGLSTECSGSGYLSLGGGCLSRVRPGRFPELQRDHRAMRRT